MTITKEFESALREAQVMLSTGQVKYFDPPTYLIAVEPSWYRPEKSQLIIFNMTHWKNDVKVEGECGTVHCIGGLVERILGRPISHTDIDAADHLFYPLRNTPVNWMDITPAHAIVAIDNFIKTGDPKWEEVLS